jgi:hypothetical protein
MNFFKVKVVVMEHRFKPCQCGEAQNQQYKKNFIFDNFYFQNATSWTCETAS